MRSSRQETLIMSLFTTNSRKRFLDMVKWMSVMHWWNMFYNNRWLAADVLLQSFRGCRYWWECFRRGWRRLLQTTPRKLHLWSTLWICLPCLEISWASLKVHNSVALSVFGVISRITISRSAPKSTSLVLTYVSDNCF